MPVSPRHIRTSVVSAVLVVGALGVAPAHATIPDLYSSGGTCQVVKADTAKTFRTRTKAVQQAKVRWKKSQARLAQARRKGTGVAAAKKAVAVAKRQLTVAERRLAPLVAQRKRACGPSVVRASVSTAGKQGNGDSDEGSLSANDRFVAFRSEASNLVPGDTNRKQDVFVRDLAKGKTTRVSVSSRGGQVNGDSWAPSISADGRYVAFVSDATNIAGDTGVQGQVLVHDRRTGTTTLVSRTPAGVAGNKWSSFPSISADGRHIAYLTTATNLSSAISGPSQVLVYDRVTRQTVRASVTPTGQVGNGWFEQAEITGDGRFVAFQTEGTNFLAGRGGEGDRMIFVWDRKTGVSRIASVSPSGAALTAMTSDPSVSWDGRYVTFTEWTRTGGSWGNPVIRRYDRLASAGSYTTLVAASGHDGSLSPDGGHLGHHCARNGCLTNLATGTTIPMARLRDDGRSAIVLEASLATGGRAAAFFSFEEDLVAKDTNGASDVFVRRR